MFYMLHDNSELKILDIIWEEIFFLYLLYYFISFFSMDPDFPDPDKGFFPIRTQEKSPIRIRTKGPRSETLVPGTDPKLRWGLGLCMIVPNQLLQGFWMFTFFIKGHQVGGKGYLPVLSLLHRSKKNKGQYSTMYATKIVPV